MKRIITLMMGLAFVMNIAAQQYEKEDSLHRVTAFEKWQPAVVTLIDGKAVTVRQANIFLKNSTLLYRNSRGKAMQALMRNIKSVDISGRHYERIDSMLFWRVDTVEQNALFCSTYIDIQALHQQILNSRVMTNLELSSEFLSTTSVEAGDDSFEYPLRNMYYYRYNGKWVRAHDRALWRVLPKSKRQDYKIALSIPGFSWTNPNSLMDLLKRITVYQ